MITIIFESHATSLDNERHVSSGHNDVALSDLGVWQAKDLGDRYQKEQFDAVFCSDLQRSYKTAEIAFGDRLPIIRDARLRECHYGELTQHPSREVDPLKAAHIHDPFPGGESYDQTAQRLGDFLRELATKYPGKKVMIIGHRATQYGLEHWLKGVSVEQAVTAPWQWQPGWTYELDPLSFTKK